MPGRRRELPAARRERLGAVEDPQQVLDAALRFLEVRQRSTDEVRRRLVGNGYRAELVQGAIERLTALGILDDEAFARAWLESRDRARPRGERALRVELRQKGIEGELVDVLLEERAGRDGVDDDPGRDVELDAARRLLARNSKTLDRVADARKRRQRAYALLVRNGFGSEAAGSAVAAWADECDATADVISPDV